MVEPQEQYTKPGTERWKFLIYIWNLKSLVLLQHESTLKIEKYLNPNTLYWFSI